MSDTGKGRYNPHYTERGRLRFTKKGGLTKAICSKCGLPVRVKRVSTKVCTNCSYTIKPSKVSCW